MRSIGWITPGLVVDELDRDQRRLRRRAAARALRWSTSPFPSTGSTSRALAHRGDHGVMLGRADDPPLRPSRALRDDLDRLARAGGEDDVMTPAERFGDSAPRLFERRARARARRHAASWGWPRPPARAPSPRALPAAPASSPHGRDRGGRTWSKARDSCRLPVEPAPLYRSRRRGAPVGSHFHSRAFTADARSHFSRPRGTSRRPFPPRHPPPRARRADPPFAPAGGRDDEQQDRPAALPNLRQARLCDLALQLPRSRQEPGPVRQRHRRAVGRRLARSTGSRASIPKRRRPGSPASASARGSACSC